MPRHSRFSNILCSHPELRSAFAPDRLFAAWWRAVLFLHGKPAPQEIIEDSPRVAVLADGFRFYAHLYRGLAVLLLAIIAVAAALPYPVLSAYTTLTGFAGCIYLFFCSRLGYIGAAAYRRREPHAPSLLVTFLVSLVAFLSILLAVASIAIHHLDILPDAANVAIAAALLVFGIGSYLIEIVYLVVATPSRMQR